MCTSGDYCNMCDTPQFELTITPEGQNCTDQCLLNNTIWVENNQQCETAAMCTGAFFVNQTDNTCVACPSLCSTC